MDFIEAIEEELETTAIKDMLSVQAGDVHQNWADINCLNNDYHYKPQTTVSKEIKFFVGWYLNYYK